jgi:hypothetical protein
VDFTINVEEFERLRGLPGAARGERGTREQRGDARRTPEAGTSRAGLRDDSSLGSARRGAGSSGRPMSTISLLTISDVGDTIPAVRPAAEARSSATPRGPAGRPIAAARRDWKPRAPSPSPRSGGVSPGTKSGESGAGSASSAGITLRAKVTTGVSTISRPLQQKGSRTGPAGHAGATTRALELAASTRDNGSRLGASQPLQPKQAQGKLPRHGSTG